MLPPAPPLKETLYNIVVWCSGFYADGANFTELRNIVFNISSAISSLLPPIEMSSEDGRLSSGAVAIIIVLSIAAVALMAAIGVALFFFRRR